MPGGKGHETPARHREAYFPQENVPECDSECTFVNRKNKIFGDLAPCFPHKS